MQEQYMIMGTGFRNTKTDGKLTGYQVNVRIPYYRGVYLSAIYGLSLKVDGADVPRDHIRIVVNGRSFTVDGAQEAGDTRWYYGDPATLVVDAPGGLKPGLHTISVGMAIRKSYLPPDDPQHLYMIFPTPDGKYHPLMEQPTVVTRSMTLVA